MNYNTGRL